MQEREKIITFFRKALAEKDSEKASVRAIALEAHRFYNASLGPQGKRLSRHTFERLVYGKGADPEIRQLTAPLRKARATGRSGTAETTPAKRARLKRDRLVLSFREAIHRLENGVLAKQAKPLHVAREAHALYLRQTPDDEIPPSRHAFERLVYGKSADPEIATLIAFRSKKQDRSRVVESFREALHSLVRDEDAPLRPRAVAMRAHQIYCANLNHKRPSEETFRKFATGKRSLPEVRLLLEQANVFPEARTRLDRKRLREVFREAVQRLESNLLRGQAKPLQVARRAYALYTREADRETSRPSPHTFQRRIYGKRADPEIMTLIQTALKGKG